jgi:hypothetical protein
MDQKDGTIIFTVETVEVPKGKPTSDGKLSERILEILGMINNPNKGVADINRMIAGEIATATGDISLLAQTDGYKLKFLTERIRALRDLSKTLTETEILSKKDILNFDGPKFQFVFQEMIGAIRKSAKETGLAEDQINTLLRNFRDTVTQMEPELRKQTEKIDSSFLQR